MVGKLLRKAKNHFFKQKNHLMQKETRANFQNLKTINGKNAGASGVSASNHKTKHISDAIEPFNTFNEFVNLNWPKVGRCF